MVDVVDVDDVVDTGVVVVVVTTEVVVVVVEEAGGSPGATSLNGTGAVLPPST